MRRVIPILLGLVVALAIPSTASATTWKIDNDCVSVARHHDGLEFDYKWGSMTGCHGGYVYQVKRKKALKNTSYGGVPDMIKTQTCGKGYYTVHRKTVFAAKHKGQVERFRKAYKKRYHRKFGPIKRLAKMPSYQPESWC